MVSPKYHPSAHNDYLVLTPKNLYLALGEFLKSWLNIICYERRLYPPESFSVHSVTSFGAIVPVSRHPSVLKWQDELISNLLENLINVQEKTSFSTVMTTLIHNKGLGGFPESNSKGKEKLHTGGNGDNDVLGILEEEEDDDDEDADGDNEELGYGAAKVIINRIKNVSLVIFRHEKTTAQGDPEHVHNDNPDPDSEDEEEENKVPIERFVVDLSHLKVVNSKMLDKEFEISDTLNWDIIYEEFKSLIFDLISNLRSSAKLISNHKQQPTASKANNKNSISSSPKTFTSLDLSALSDSRPSLRSDAEKGFEDQQGKENIDCSKLESGVVKTEISFTYDIFLETDKRLNISNYDTEGLWVLDPDEVVSSETLTLNSSLYSSGGIKFKDNENDENEMESQNGNGDANRNGKGVRVKVKSFKPVEVSPLNIYCHCERIVE